MSAGSAVCRGLLGPYQPPVYCRQGKCTTAVYTTTILKNNVPYSQLNSVRYQDPDKSKNLAVCNISCVHKRHSIASSDSCAPCRSSGSLGCIRVVYSSRKRCRSVRRDRFSWSCSSGCSDGRAPPWFFLRVVLAVLFLLSLCRVSKRLNIAVG